MLWLCNDLYVGCLWLKWLVYFLGEVWHVTYLVFGTRIVDLCAHAHFRSWLRSKCVWTIIFVFIYLCLYEYYLVFSKFPFSKIVYTRTSQHIYMDLTLCTIPRYVKRYLPMYLPLGYLPFYQPGYYPFCFEFSQNFVRFRRFASGENVKKLQIT